ncbi:hypothetical protein GP486_007937 [Trichoglossum hirsutum]|uniref:Uncharacterized protein n=1 Tax=Trichoglossum hirsutum TaxID=265104 RepID=A0A9P8IHM8_9PEZI|nr:hypothetical protein GP486_007937 [Trichoglossum hirsutum]
MGQPTNLRGKAPTKHHRDISLNSAKKPDLGEDTGKRYRTNPGSESNHYMDFNDDSVPCHCLLSSAPSSSTEQQANNKSRAQRDLDELNCEARKDGLPLHEVKKTEGTLPVLATATEEPLWNDWERSSSVDGDGGCPIHQKAK